MRKALLKSLYQSLTKKQGVLLGGCSSVGIAMAMPILWSIALLGHAFASPSLSLPNTQPDASLRGLEEHGQPIVQTDPRSLEATGSDLPIALIDLNRFPLFSSASQGNLVASSNLISPTQISSPSLVWTQEKLGDRYGSDRLIEQWRAYRVTEPVPNSLNPNSLNPNSLNPNSLNPNSLNYVDVIVNQRIWNLLSYFERYAFISQFGSETKEYGYSLRVFHSGDIANLEDRRTSQSANFVALRGAYLCPFGQIAVPPTPEETAALPCEVVFNRTTGRRVLPN